MSPLTPEQQDRERIDAMLLASGWVVQDVKTLNLMPTLKSSAIGLSASVRHAKCGFTLLV